MEKKVYLVVRLDGSRVFHTHPSEGSIIGEYATKRYAVKKATRSYYPCYIVKVEPCGSRHIYSGDYSFSYKPTKQNP